jgi:hypothetical protein
MVEMAVSVFAENVLSPEVARTAVTEEKVGM